MLKSISQALAGAIVVAALAGATPAMSAGDAYQPNQSGTYPEAYRPRPSSPDDSYRPPSNAAPDDRYDDRPPPRDRSGYGEPYTPPRQGERYDNPPPQQAGPGYYEKDEILHAGGRFFGSVSKGLASAVEYTFRKSGRPNGYILGEDAGGAFVAGLRYGKGMLYTKDAGEFPVYWQGPSIGYDVGGAGSKTMVLVYNLRDPSEIYQRFAGVEGSAYVVGGVSVQYQQNDDIVLAPIRAGVGLRLGANVGYLKYTRSPTWNPF